MRTAIRARLQRILCGNLSGNGTSVSIKQAKSRNVVDSGVYSAVGTPLAWPEAKKEADKVRRFGIAQLLATWRRNKGKEGDELK